MPTLAPDSEVVVILSTGGLLMVMEKVWVAVPAALSVTCMVKLTVPATVGVPEMTPVEALRLNPAGNEPIDTDQV